MTDTHLSDTAPRSVLLTGAAGGIGRALVRALLAAGHRVAAVDQDAAALQALRALVPPGVDSLLLLQADLCVPAAAGQVVGDAVQRFGGLDAVVNNAGIGGSGFWHRRGRARPLFWEVEPALWDTFMQVNVGAAFHIGRAAAPHLMASGRGRIVNVTTSLLTMLDHKMVPYGPSKAAAEALTAIMAADLEGRGATANVLIPGGPTDTAMVVGVDRQQLLSPDIMAPPLLWLLSDEAATTTGRRFVAHLWDAALPPSEAAARSGAPVAWSQLAQESGRYGNSASLIYQGP